MATTQKEVVKTQVVIHHSDTGEVDYSDLIKSATLTFEQAMVDTSAGSAVDQSAPGTWKFSGEMMVQHRRDHSDMKPLMAILRAEEPQKFAFRTKPGPAAPDNLEFRCLVHASRLTFGAARGSARESTVPLAINAATYYDGTNELTVEGDVPANLFA